MQETKPHSAVPWGLGRYKVELAWVAAGLILAVALGYGVKLRVAAAANQRQGVVLSATGTVAVDRVQVLAEVAGVVREIPEKGQRAVAGQPLARVENLDLEAAVALARSQLDAARSDLARTQASARVVDSSELDRAVKAASAALEAAQKAADGARAGNTSASRTPQSTAAAGNKSATAQAKGTSVQVPHHPPTASQGQIRTMGGHGNVQSAQKKAAAPAASAQAGSSALDPGRVQQLNAQVEVARANLELAKARKAEAAAAARPEDASVAHARVQQAQLALTLAEQKLQKAALNAPLSGLVVELLVAKGAPVNIGQPLVVLSNEASTYVTMKIRSKDAGSVEIGQKALVTVGGTTVDGRVAAVSREPSGASTTVKVTLEPAGHRFTDGAEAAVKILSEPPVQ